MSKKNVEIVKRFFEAAPRSNLAGARSVLDPNKGANFPIQPSYNEVCCI